MNYWDYIKVEQLLSLQGGAAPEGSEPSNDEVLFITVHQIYELWFKLVLRELRAVRALFRKNPVPDQALAAACRSLRRSVAIFELAAEHWRVVETLTPRDYLGFRDQLIGASGFQSAQIRQIEIVLGLEDDKRLSLGGDTSYKDMLRGPGGSSTPALARVENELAGLPSYKDALYDWLARTPIDGISDPAHVANYIDKHATAYESHARSLCDAAVAVAATSRDKDILVERYRRDIDAAQAFLRGTDRPQLDARARERLRHVRAALVFIESHRELPRLAWPREVLDATIALEQAMIVWRQRHARMVERIIGRRTGTGGSDGVDYLDATALRYRIFDELWAVRSIMLRRELAPPLAHEDDYRFRIED